MAGHDLSLTGDGVDVQAISDTGMAVGYETSPPGTYTAVAWINGKAVPVTSLIAGSFSGTLTNAIDVNNNGSILAEGLPAGSTTVQTYLLAAPTPLRLFATALEGTDGKHVTHPRTLAGGVVVSVTGVTDEQQIVNEATRTNGAGEYQFKLVDGTYTLHLEKGVCVDGVAGCAAGKRFRISGRDERINQATIPDAVAQPMLLTSYDGDTPLSPVGIPLVIGHNTRSQRLLAVGSAPVVVTSR